MTNPTIADKCIIAFEVSKASLVVHRLPEDVQCVIANKSQAVKRFLQRHGKRDCVVICEATGGYERHVLAGCEALGLPVHRAHGSRTRAFATYRGLAAKTDAIDARMLAEYGRDTPNLRVYQPPGEHHTQLRQLRKRRDELMSLLRMERNRLEHAAHKRVKQSIKRSITLFERECAQLEKAMQELVRQCEDLCRKERLIRSIKGVGPATATACLAYLPELGAMNKKQVANLVGLAPIAKDSGKYRGSRHIGGGRKIVRSSLYMAAIVAINHNHHFSAYAKKLRQKGKPQKVIITAIMRRLIVIINAVIKTGQPCRQT